MADLGQEYVEEELEDAGGDFEPLPAGEYNVIIVSTDLLPTNATKEDMGESQSFEEYLKVNPDAGGYLKVELDIVDGPLTGRKIFTNLNLFNSNEKAVQIARSHLKQIMSSTGTSSMKNTEVLHGKTLRVRLDAKPGKGEYADRIQNNVKKFMPYAVDAPAGATQAKAAGGQAPF